MAAQVNLKALEEELLEHNEFFDMLCDMIPSKLYVAGQSGDDYNPKYFKKGASEKDARKAAAKAAKRQKLDPELARSTKEVNTQGSAAGGVPSMAKPAKQTTPGQSRIEALRAKLHAKIASSQQRPGVNAETVSKRAARRAEKNRRKAEAQKRKSASKTKANDTTKNTSYTINPTSLAADPMEDLQHVDYGIISGLNNTDAKTNYLETNKALKSKNLHKLLADAEAKRQKLQALQKSSDAQDKEKANAMQWSDAFREADGTRVKDDPSKLRKAVKRREAKKNKSQKAWKTRLEQQSQSSKSRQQIRQHNLQMRKRGGVAGANLSKKKIASASDPQDEERKGGGQRGGCRAGFEGRKQDFLNSPRDGGVVVGSKQQQKQQQ